MEKQATGTGSQEWWIFSATPLRLGAVRDISSIAISHYPLLLSISMVSYLLLTWSSSL
uniref:Uncharacterized protein n=1 Tax=Arundo donax TaxID=35708 RepID=A0A0A9ST73_ARUDO